MSIASLSQLSTEEVNLVLNTPALVSLLIGGADNNFDNEEKERAKKIVAFRKTTGDPLLFEYFNLVEETFENEIQILSERYSGDALERNSKITEELVKLNEILPKMDHNYANALLQNWRTLAKGVAEASGGFLGMFEESSEEAHLVGLKMIEFGNN
ncbi:MAG: hypothetical protein IPH74_15515 [Bacteroidetes bacterium]|jgi:hypothetical protein|nr:hypothetical protein [Bacteroidota bacterium]MBP7256789.1 hypothetical protein [Chitinophagales bacterium]MBK7140333.1 hypothetical protein [Bacteroidota bacterium]MBK7503736.1 hypothetical protein [Bacteroidota bacterium]MBK7638830.1 hypothetical protein [Bacteroidota bacterium]